MQIKKNPKYNLENYSKLFMQLGLVLTLFITYVIIEKQTLFDKDFIELQEPVSLNYFPEDETIITKRPEKEIFKEKKPKLIEHLIDIKPDDENFIEDLIEPILEQPLAEPFIDSILEEPIDEVIVEDVPIDFVENVPVFPGCKGTNKELKDCFNKKMQKHFQKKFNSDLPNQLGLSPGRKRVLMLFKIDKQGNIIDIITKAPHPKLDKEAERIIKLLPKMKPGMQQGKAVRVKYTLPMRIDVD